jgi:hypothetical protein
VDFIDELFIPDMVPDAPEVFNIIGIILDTIGS